MVTYKYRKNGDLTFSTNGKNWRRVYSQTKCSKVKVSAAFSKLVRAKPKVPQAQGTSSKEINKVALPKSKLSLGRQRNSHGRLESSYQGLLRQWHQTIW